MGNFDKKFLALLVIVLLVSALVLTKGWWPRRGGDSSYKSVLLTNKMSYFGKIKNTGADFVTLRDVFYLRLKPAATGSGSANPATAASFELVKLGSEIYGPEDSITLNRKQIVTIESLKEESQVVQSIRKYYLNRGGSK
jgi:hypothetical protein